MLLYICRNYETIVKYAIFRVFTIIFFMESLEPIPVNKNFKKTKITIFFL